MTRARLLGIDGDVLPPMRARYFFGTVEYRVTLRWNEREEIWTMTVAPIDGDPIIEGIRCATGRDALGNVPNLIGRLVAEDTSGNGVEPASIDAWRTGARIVWETLE